MGIVLYQYSYIREDALTKKLIKYENEQAFDNVVNGVWQNPYATGYTLGFSAQDSTLYGSTIVYSFPATIWKSNITASSVEFDADDGRGYKIIAKGGSLSVTYSSGGIKDLKMRVKLPSGSYLYCHSLAKIISDSEVSTRAIKDGLIKPDETVDFEATSPYNGITAKGRISYLYGSNNGKKIKKPFIVMKGFDPIELVKKEEAYLGDIKYGSTNLKTFVKYLREKYEAYYKLTSEYDIIYIDLFDCKHSIQTNARLFERAMEIVNEKKVQDGCTEKNIIFAQSMGGLIARYGLKEMENQGKIHDTSLLFFQDVPHLGVHIPLGILQGMNGLLKFYYEKELIGALDFGDIKSKLAPILYSDAAKQMLINFVNDNGDLDNSVHNAWQRELTQMGYPQGDNGYKMRIVSISNGQTPVLPNTSSTSYIYIDGNVHTSIIGDVFLYFFTFNFSVNAVLDDWQAVCLSLLPGSSTLAVHFEANLPYGANPICDMYVHYTKKFLWLIKIGRTIFSYRKFYPSSMIRYDNMPGSFYTVPGLNSGDKEDDHFSILYGGHNLKTSFTNKMMFIPTVSSLDIGEGKIELTESDYKKKYLMDFPPQAPKHTPFDAFYITNGSTYHTSFEPTMLDWIMEQMKVTVDGPNVAINGSKYSIRNNTMNYSITWSSSDESVATIDNTGTLTMKKSGVVRITANCVINSVTTKFYKDVLVGFPSFVLEWSIDGVYVVKARCIDPKAVPFLKYLQFEWKLKGESGQSSSSSWIQTDVPERKVNASERANKVTVYMRPINAEGISGDPLFISFDATAPYLFEPRDIYYVYGSEGSVDYKLEFYANPFYENQEALANNELFKTVEIRSFERDGSFENRIYLDTPSTSGIIRLSEFWQGSRFDNWYRSCSRGSTSNPELSLILNFMNKDGKMVTIRVLRCVFRKSR